MITGHRSISVPLCSAQQPSAECSTAGFAAVFHQQLCNHSITWESPGLGLLVENKYHLNGLGITVKQTTCVRVCSSQLKHSQGLALFSITSSLSLDQFSGPPSWCSLCLPWKTILPDTWALTPPALKGKRIIGVVSVPCWCLRIRLYWSWLMPKNPVFNSFKLCYKILIIH